jgi:hypothetical protein
MTRKEKRAAKRNKRLERMTAAEDIRYRGPLSYRTYKVLGWVCILLSQIVTVLSLVSKADPAAAEELQSVSLILDSLSSLALPFLLIANFALILNHSEGYAVQIRRYAALALMVLILSVILFSRYAVGTAAIATGDRREAMAFLESWFWEASPKGYFAFNLFIDLLLCAMLMYFLNERPKRVFTGKRVLIFRAFAALPILYETASILLKALATAGKVRLPLILFPFLTVKPPLTFLVFLVMAVFIKRREVRYCRSGRTYEEYLGFLDTNRNSWDFARFTAKILAVAGMLDLILVLGVILSQTGLEAEADAANIAEMMDRSAFGLGESFSLLLLAPIMLLFSYTRTHKNKILDTLIPAIGVAAIVLAYLEGLYQVLRMVPDMLSDPAAMGALMEYGALLG